jgi:hypothetical protein
MPILGVVASGSFQPIPVVTGGTLTSDATFYYRTFTSNGSLTISNATLTGDYLVVAGGRNGGSSQRFVCCGYAVGIVGGGGGAGGYREFTSQSLVVGTYTCTVGAAGADSSLTGPASLSITSTKGGQEGSSGGSGGGGGASVTVGLGNNQGPGGAGNTPPTSPSQGNNGGNGSVVL